MLNKPLFNPLAEAFSQQCRQWMRQSAAPAEIQQTVARLAGLLVNAVAEGHLCLDLSLLATEDLLTPAEWSASGVVRLSTETTTTPMVLEGQRLYLARHFQAEVSTAQQLRRLAETRRLCVISGGPGTGKTTTVARLLGRLFSTRPDSHPNTRVVLAAPTGKAAARMMEALQARASTLPEGLRARLPTSAMTLHRLLGWNPKQDKPRHHAGNPLWLDILIVDEASMLDQALAAQLLDALPLSATLVLLGDKDQLAAVEAGAVFAEVSEIPGCLPSGTEALDAWLDELLGLGMSPQTRQLVAIAQAAAKGAARKAAERQAKRRQALLERQADLFGDLPTTALAPTAASIPVPSPTAAPEYNGPQRVQDCVVWLQTSHRFRADSALGRVAAAVREGDVAKSLHTLLQASKAADDPNTDCAWLEEGNGGLSVTAQAWLLAGYQPYQMALLAWLRQEITLADLFAAFDRFRVLAAVHGGSRGVRAINHLINEARTQWLQTTDLPPELPPNSAAGQPVLVLENDRATGLFNGDVGLILPSPLEAWFPASTASGYRTVPLACLPKHDIAFAMTVHKSQGSEFNRVALVLPDEESPILTRELVYTGLTRAKNGVAVLASADILASAIANPTQRDTALGERLRP
jgi:exodeoxyribonuclease V alpha subunit